jgi:hypothetical protein
MLLFKKNNMGGCVIGKISYVRHYVIPEKNNGKEYYIYCINSFI